MVGSHDGEDFAVNQDGTQEKLMVLLVCSVMQVVGLSDSVTNDGVEDRTGIYIR
jgi:hypothetical protein